MPENHAQPHPTQTDLAEELALVADQRDRVARMADQIEDDYEHLAVVVRHVLRYGRLGKRSQRRLRTALERRQW